MPLRETKLEEFNAYAQLLKGDEKGEAQVFCDRLFQAFGHAGYREAGATLEHRVRIGKGTKFADLFWKDTMLLEMKKRGSVLQRHYRQAFEYWQYLVPNRPRYVVLCNFDEFLIYDFNTQLDLPVDRVPLADLPRRYRAFSFLLPQPTEPQFQNNLVSVTRDAADKVATAYRAIKRRTQDQKLSQHFVLQCVFAMFAEDFGLLPKGLFSELLKECAGGQSSYDLIGGLFRQMNTPERARGGRFQEVDYFNGGLFADIQPLDLTPDEAHMLHDAAQEDWSRIQPIIFGSIFQESMDGEERHAFGAHFTSESDIQKVVLPTIVRPWRERIATAKTRKDLLALRGELSAYSVLDPACGSGNFLYVAYRELRRIELEILDKLARVDKPERVRDFALAPAVRETNFYGFDNHAFAVELAKVTMILAKELALAESRDFFHGLGINAPDLGGAPLPLVNMDKNIVCADALFSPWPKASAIIGNPPFQSKNKMQQELGANYVGSLHAAFGDRIPGRADYCVYWFHRAHDELPPGGRAGLVGTNTIRQNYSREGGLDHIVTHGGTITEAVSTQVWSGDAAVHVSIVNWIKGEAAGPKRLTIQLGDQTGSPWVVYELPFINSALSPNTDVTGAKDLSTNSLSQTCYQGQTHGHKGFLLSISEKDTLLKREPRAREILFPFLTGDDLLGNIGGYPSRFVIDLNRCTDVLELTTYGRVYHLLRERVLPEKQKKAEDESITLGKENGPRQQHYKTWWKFWRSRPELMCRLNSISRYIVCARVTKRPVFEFVSADIHPNDALMVFPLADDYSFGILQSGQHWAWFKARCSTLKGDFRYTSDSVFNSFPWPQAPTQAQALAVAKAGRELRAMRSSAMQRIGCSLRALYRSLDVTGKNPLKDAHAKLDEAVRQAYGFSSGEGMLESLLALNLALAAREAAGETVVGPGLPADVSARTLFISDDCVQMP
ncbi:class I SAM-dependent DNA methyltransferase [Nitratidesulfovibrio vulgaris]|uniref:class I SAM-dependent DNA methyltransferase n=1 Tax=Nitratidesulfovibrio vulgaris TaxID=881 RepID=UPI002301DD25|nr:DNA methyltransferase [Nitratidesulfovibrio vulgaris]WCB47059.1 N-6 DNA methylase [Nitratidesulfovibrio vulgaris]